jgi:hypothetical protein
MAWALDQRMLGLVRPADQILLGLAQLQNPMLLSLTLLSDSKILNLAWSLDLIYLKYFKKIIINLMWVPINMLVNSKINGILEQCSGIN